MIENYKHHLENLNFHDSLIDSISFKSGDLFDRTTTLVIDYYNWEGNSEEGDEWVTKKLVLELAHTVHLEINAPNLAEDCFEIGSCEYDELFNEFVKKTEAEKTDSYYIYLQKKSFDNFLSIKFNIQNYSESLFGKPSGFIWIAGFNVAHKWLHETQIQGKKHIRPKV